MTKGATVQSQCTWRQAGTFEHVAGSQVPFWSDVLLPGEERRPLRGPTPIEMLLGALCGCTGVDVVSILEKMKLKPVQMSMSAEAERGEEHPRILRRIWITYSIETEPPDAAKVFRAVELSAQKYCAVAATLAAAGEIRYRVLSASEEREGVFAGAGASPHP